MSKRLLPFLNTELLALALSVAIGLTSLAQEGQSTKPDAEGKGVKEEAKPEDTAEKKDQEDEKDDASLPVVAIKGADIHTMSSKGIINDGVVLIKGSRIHAVGGSELKVPENATVVDASNCVITPGLIDAASSLWMTSASRSASASDGSLQTLDGLDPFADDWHSVVRGGVTSVYVQPSSRGALSGMGAVLSTVPGDDLQIKVLNDMPAIQASLGVGASNNRSRKSQYDRLKKTLDGAAAYQKKWDEYNEYLKKQEEAKKAGGKSKPKEADKKEEPKPKKEVEKKPMPKDPRAAMIMRARAIAEAKKRAEAAKQGKSDGTKTAEEKKKEPPKKPEKNPVLERLSKMLKGELPMRLRLRNADDAFYAAELQKQFKDLQIVFEDLRAMRSASFTQSTTAPLVTGPWLAVESEYVAGQYTEDDSLASWMKDYEGAKLIGTFASSAKGSAFLLQHAKRAVGMGLDEETVLRGVTVDAARVLGVSDKIGSIEAGKQADLVCFSAAPLSAAAQIVHVMVSGKTIYECEAKAVEVVSTDAEGIGLPANLPSEFRVRSNRFINSEGKVQAAELTVKDGVIAGFGEASSDSKGTVYDLGDQVVSVGLFSGAAQLGTQSLTSPARRSDATYIAAADALGDLGPLKKVAKQGLLQALLLPASNRTLSGQASLIRVGATPAVIKRQASAVLSLAGSARSAESFPSSLAGQLQVLQNAFNGRFVEPELFAPQPVVERLAALRGQTMEMVKQQKLPVIIAAESDLELKSALDLIGSKKLNASLLGPLQLAPFVDRIVELKASVIAKPIRPTDQPWYRDDLVGALNAGVAVAFATESPEEIQISAEQLLQGGASLENVLKAITGQASANFAGAAFAVNLPADFVIWNDLPVSLSAKPSAVVLGGERLLAP